MKITLEMACSINGYIATEEGNEDFLSNHNWKIMLDFLKEQDVLIWGRKTFDNVISWGDEYLKDLKGIKVIVISENLKSYNFDNVYCCSSIENCLTFCQEKGFTRLFISGGSTINSSFMEKDLVDIIILNYNPYVLGNGIPLFRNNNFQNKLKLIKIVNESEDIIQIHYKVLKSR